MDLHTFAPFSHVYTFDRGFPPATLSHMFHLFNVSETSTTLICYQKPKRVYELGLASTTKMVQRFPMKMSGSGEQHSCFVFVKESALSSLITPPIISPATTECGMSGVASLRSTLKMPPIPFGSSDYDSPVLHGATYNDTGIQLAAEVMRTTNTLDDERVLHRRRYTEWVVDQLGLSSAARSKRTSRHNK